MAENNDKKRLSIKDEVKELPVKTQKKLKKDKNNAAAGAGVGVVTTAGTAVFELINESLPLEMFAGAGVFGFLLWGVFKFFEIEAEEFAAHLFDDEQK